MTTSVSLISNIMKAELSRGPGPLLLPVPSRSQCVPFVHDSTVKSRTWYIIRRDITIFRPLSQSDDSNACWEEPTRFFTSCFGGDADHVSPNGYRVGNSALMSTISSTTVFVSSLWTWSLRISPCLSGHIVYCTFPSGTVISDHRVQQSMLTLVSRTDVSAEYVYKTSQQNLSRLLK